MVGLYIRLSHLDEDLDEYKQTSNSVENQKKLLTEYVEKMPDLRAEQTEEFIDDGWSGTDFQRPAFQRMLKLIKNRTVTAVIVKDFSRFGRNYIECADYLEKLFPLFGIRFISVSDNYDSAEQDEDRQLEIAVKNIINSCCLQDLSKKILSTFNMKKEHGEFFLGVPFGYIKDYDHPGRIAIDNEAAEIVRHIFSLACKGIKAGDIAKILNKESIPTISAYNREHNITGKGCPPEKSIYAAWTGCKVSRVLKNEIYMGTYVCRRRKRAAVGMKKTVMVKDTRKIPNNHPAIVDKAEFEKAQMVFTKLKPEYTENKSYQLKSKVVCGNCGYNMTYQDNNREEGYFSCSYTNQTGRYAGCSGDRFSEKLLNIRVFSQLKLWITMVEADCGSTSREEQTRREELRHLSNRRELLQADFKAQQRKKLKLYKAYSENRLDSEGFLKHKEKLTAETGFVKAELNKIYEKISKLEKKRKSINSECESIMKNAAIFENERELTCKMADAFVERVKVYDKQHIEIIWKFEDFAESALKPELLQSDPACSITGSGKDAIG